MKYCLYCKNPIIATNRTKYCSDDCYRRAKNLRKAQWNKGQRAKRKLSAKEKPTKKAKATPGSIGIPRTTGKWDYYCTRYHQLMSAYTCEHRQKLNHSTGKMIDSYCREKCKGMRLRESTEMERRVHRNRIREVERQVGA